MMKKIKEIIGLRVRAARKKLGLTQDELASKTKVSLTTINRFEKGKQLPQPENLKLIVETLNIENLFDGFDESEIRDTIDIQSFAKTVAQETSKEVLKGLKKPQSTDRGQNLVALISRLSPSQIDYLTGIVEEMVRLSTTNEDKTPSSGS